MKRILLPVLFALAACSKGTYVKLAFEDVPSGATSIACDLTLASKTATATFTLKSGETNPTGSLQIESGSGSMTVSCTATNSTPGPEPLGTATGTVNVVTDKTETLTLSFGAAHQDGGVDASGDMTTTDSGTDMMPTDMTVLTPMIVMTPSTRDYGTLTTGTTSAAGAFTVTNNGDGATPALTISIDNNAFILSSGGTCQNAPLAAGASCQFAVAFKPSGPGATAGNVTVSYAGIMGAAPSSTVTGTAIAPGALAWSPNSADFGSVQLGSTSNAQTFTLKNTGGATTGTIAISLGGSDSGAFEINNDGCTATTLAMNATCTVVLDYKPLGKGAASATLQATASPGGTAISSLSGNGLSQAALSVSTNDVNFGTVTIGSTGTKTITVSNTGDVASGGLSFSVPGFVTSGGTCTSGQAIAGNANCTVMLTFAPTAYGAKTGNIMFSATPGGSQSVSIEATGQDYVTVLVAPLPAADGAIVDDAGHFNCSSTSTMCQYVYARTADINVTFTATAADTFTFDSWTYANSPPACADATMPACAIKLDSSVLGSNSSTASTTPYTYNANFTGP